MPKRRRRSFTPQFKAQVVLEVLAGLRSQAEVAREHKLKPELIARWKEIALGGLETLFQGGERRNQDEDCIAELERMVGRLTMELEVAKKSLGLAPLGPEERREVILTLAAEYPVRLICRATGWPRSSAYHEAAPAADERRLRRALRRLAARWPTYGHRRLTAMLRREGWSVNGKRVRRLMAEMGLKGKAPARRRRTTDSRHHFPRYPNLVEGLKVSRPDQAWVADITYVRFREEFVYLAVVMDVFTRRVRGWQLGRGLDQGLTVAALRRAMRRGRRPEVHHSDQGVQYAATAYTDLLAGRGVAISMAAVGKPEENGFAERLMRTIKEEEVDLSEYQDFGDAHRQLGRFLDDVYNRKRIHSALGYLTPAEFEQQWLRGQQAAALP